ncbi:hypothetical protein JTE90_025359 [Oedothorax gibbosus]|uniref:Uncharacterized protein n=1 Tax=Oedothorax gibbosus TaxID=931172 RepID=A0AAV6UAE3_9ARAC|nr:hypothetical protein JTE90_025359 [Oedothorax gibbosus]
MAAILASLSLVLLIATIFCGYLTKDIDNVTLEHPGEKFNFSLFGDLGYFQGGRSGSLIWRSVVRQGTFGRAEYAVEVLGLKLVRSVRAKVCALKRIILFLGTLVRVKSQNLHLNFMEERREVSHCLIIEREPRAPRPKSFFKG